MTENNGSISTREQILKVALRLFAVEGYRQTSMEDIAREVGISKPAIYHYFNGKETLFRQIVDDALTFHRKTVEEIAKQSLTLPELIEESIKSSMTVIRDTPDLIRMLVRLISSNEGVEEFLDVHGIDCEIHQMEVEIFRRAFGAEQLRPGLNLETFVEFFHGVLFSFMARCLMEPTFISQENMPAILRDLILYGALVQPAK
ncbi:MAG: TetR/AcrR family transcriptional regulator [Myxococcales bacterium]|nr:TetR/AcrR family transcriptional regulator [Myxococcales bacterium]